MPQSVYRRAKRKVSFAQQGARVAVSGRRKDAGEALVRELRTFGAEAAFIAADVRHDEEVGNLVRQAIKVFGRLDVAVNAAGTEGMPGAGTEQTAETYAATFDTNVLGTLLSMKTRSAALEVASSGVRVIAVAPGPTDTGMLDRFTGNAENKAGLVSGVPLRRAARAEEIAQAILFAASEKASFMTGHILAVDGGKSS